MMTTDKPLSAILSAVYGKECPAYVKKQAEFIEAYAAQQCAEKDKQLEVLGKLYKEEGTRFNKARDDSFKLKAERDQAIADVKRLREALERALSYVGHEGDSVALSETLAATDKPEYE